MKTGRTVIVKEQSDKKRPAGLDGSTPRATQAHRDALEAFRSKLPERIFGDQGGVGVASEYAGFVDNLLASLVAEAKLSYPPHTALAAVGGYGRYTLAPYADIDVLFLSESLDDDTLAQWANTLLYPLWDLGIPIDHAVRSVQETLDLAEQDIRTATTLFDLRHVLGDEALVGRLTEQGHTLLYAQHKAFIQTLEADVSARQERFGGSLYLLEPEVKLGRGGLRDYDAAYWAARARWGAHSWQELVAQQVLLDREVQELQASHEFLWRVRNALHIRAGRRHDRLTFSDQEEIAVGLGYTDHVTLAVEQFMQHYYQHAQTIAYTTDRLIARARVIAAHPSQTRLLPSGIVAGSECVEVRQLDELRDNPSLALQLYVEAIHHNLHPSIEVRDAIARLASEADWTRRLRDQPQATDAFLTLLGYAGVAPVRRGSVLGELLEVGLMLAMVPEFDHVRGRVQHDVYHVYTVDVHSVAGVDRLSEMVRGEHAGAWPLASRLAAETPRPLPLRLGLLLHDVGKGRGGHHAEIGADIAELVAARLGFSSADVAHVTWLVREHLRLYHWAVRRDISDPQTIEEAVNVIKTEERLRDLYVLTVADISTTSPTAMTSWKANMLQELYFAVSDAIQTARPWSGERRAEALRKELVQAAGGEHREAFDCFVQAMPDRYVLANSAAAIKEHAQLLMERDADVVHVGVRQGASAETDELVIITDDRPGLLASIAAALSSHRLDVTAAQIYTFGPAEKRLVFDIFQVRSSKKVNAKTAERLGRDIEALVSGELTADALLARRASSPPWARRKEPGVSLEVHINNKASRRFSVIDVFTRDHPGLLYAIAHLLHQHGLSIALSKLSTEGNRVADVFYVQTFDGQRLEDPEKIARLERDLRAILAKL